MIETLLLFAVLCQQPPDGGREPLALIEELKAEDPAARRKAVEALLELGAAAVPVGLTVLADERPGLDEQVDGLVKQLAAPEWKSRDAAQQALVKLGRHARLRLQKHRGSEDLEVAWRVRTALAEIEEREKEEAGTESVRNAGLCEFLGRAGETKAVPLLLRQLEATAPGAREPEDAELTLRVRALEALGRLRKGLSAEQADTAAELAYRMLAENRDRRRVAILLQTLGRLKSQVVLTSLITMLKDGDRKDVHFKRLVMRALQSIGESRGAKAIIEELGADDVYLRDGAIEVLAEMAGTDFGFDPIEAPSASGAKVQAAKQWWEKKFGKAWTE